MGIFGRSFKRELGKNTGKWVSNKIFGDNWATPHKLIIQRERNDRKIERESARSYKLDVLQQRRDERELERQNKIQEIEYGEQQKENLIQKNTKEVNDHNNYLEVIQSVHKDYGNMVDWDKIKNQKGPNEIKSGKELLGYYQELTNKQCNEKNEELKEQYKLSFASQYLSRLYQPEYSKIIELASSKFVAFGIYLSVIGLYQWNGLLSIILGCLFGMIYLIVWIVDRDLKNVIKLKDEIEKNKEERNLLIVKYVAEQNSEYEKYLKAKADYDHLREIANGVINKDVHAYIYAINLFDPFKELKNYGAHFSLNLVQNKLVIDFFPQGEDVIPRTFKRLINNGIRIKEDWIPNSKFYDIFQDYVCSCILRVAKEIFAIVPADEILINTKCSVIDTTIGKPQEQIILSVLIPNGKLNDLNFNLLDPSESMMNFKCNMNFKKGEGFKPVNEIEIISNDSNFLSLDLS